MAHSKYSRLHHNVIRKLTLAVHGHILNPLWRPRQARRWKRESAIERSLLSYLKIYKKDIEEFIPDNRVETNEKVRVFTLWLQGEDNAPAIVKACFRSMRRHLRQELVILDQTNLFDWIDLPDYIIDKWKKGIIGPAHFSDLCRVELLFQHGGIWLDSTAFVTAPIPKEIEDTDFFVYKSGHKLGGWFAFIQNCFIGAKKGNPLLAVWRHAMHLYWKYENHALNYYIHQLLFEFVTIHNKVASDRFSLMPQKIQDPTHILWYEHKDDPYDESRFAEYTSGAFFQKTNYKDKSSYSPEKDTMAYFLLHS